MVQKYKVGDLVRITDESAGSRTMDFLVLITEISEGYYYFKVIKNYKKYIPSVVRFGDDSVWAEKYARLVSTSPAGAILYGE